MSNDLLKYISDRLQTEIKVMSDDTAAGKAKDFGEYKYACGIIRGLMMANNILIETAERLENSDD
jgi:hypothetical protein